MVLYVRGSGGIELCPVLEISYCCSGLLNSSMRRRTFKCENAFGRKYSRRCICQTLLKCLPVVEECLSGMRGEVVCGVAFSKLEPGNVIGDKSRKLTLVMHVIMSCHSLNLLISPKSIAVLKHLLENYCLMSSVLYCW